MNDVHDKLNEAAKALGREHGVQRAEWAVNSNNCTVDAARRIVTGFDDGDPIVMDLCPEPLSGEWADDPTPMAILDEIANKIDHHSLRGEMIDDREDVLTSYEESFKEAFWDQVVLASKTIVDGAA